MELLEKLKILMEQNGIRNARELSNKLEEEGLAIPYTTLLTILNGDVKNIKIQNAQKFCDFFNITLDSLLNDSVDLTELKDIKYASYNGLNLEGLNETDLKEIQEIIKIKQKMKKNKKD